MSAPLPPPTAAAELDEISEDTAELVFALVGSMRAHVAERCAEFDLSPPQAMALHHLRRALPMRELACTLGCDASNVTGIVDRLEGRGLVERRVDPSDRRVKNLVLTDEGARLRRLLKARVISDVPGFAGLGPSERRTLRDLLRRVTGDQDEGGSAVTALVGRVER